MARNTDKGTLKIGDGRDNEDQIEVIDPPVDRDTIGRPTWWFTGSIMIPKTYQEHKLATLHYQTLAQTNVVLSYRAHRIRNLISVLSEWFPLPFLDEIGKGLLMCTGLQQNDENLCAHFLGMVEAALRQRQGTIRWKVLKEISQTTGYQIRKADISKWLFFTLQQKKIRSSDTLGVVHHLTLEFIAQQTLPAEQKRNLSIKLDRIIRILKTTCFVCKDPEITAWSLKRLLLQEKGVQTDIPLEFRAATTRMTYRLRKLVNI